jgi:hypothetical protein
MTDSVASESNNFIFIYQTKWHIYLFQKYRYVNWSKWHLTLFININKLAISLQQGLRKSENCLKKVGGRHNVMGNIRSLTVIDCLFGNESY